jgi:hypothetical protein
VSGKPGGVNAGTDTPSPNVLGGRGPGPRTETENWPGRSSHDKREHTFENRAAAPDDLLMLSWWDRAVFLPKSLTRTWTNMLLPSGRTPAGEPQGRIRRPLRQHHRL